MATLGLVERLKVIFFGTAELACASLENLVKNPALEILGVVTQPDRPQGRDLRVLPTPVKVEALRWQLAVWQPERAREAAFFQMLQTLPLDLAVVTAYGQILPPSILGLPRFGCLNVHASLLPKYRGAAPIQWAILNDESETGVTIIKMDAGLDTGDILTQERTLILPEDNARTLHQRLAALGAELLLRTIPNYVAGKISPRAQPKEGGSYARKITKDDGRLDWTQPARVLWNRIRAFNPWPGAFTFLPGEPKPVLLKVWAAEIEARMTGAPGHVLQADKTGIVVGCGAQALRILVLQREGGRRLTAQEFLAGHRGQSSILTQRFLIWY